jgi:hypothetical protein
MIKCGGGMQMPVARIRHVGGDRIYHATRLIDHRGSSGNLLSIHLSNLLKPVLSLFPPRFRISPIAVELLDRSRSVPNHRDQWEQPQQGQYAKSNPPASCGVRISFTKPAIGVVAYFISAVQTR